MDNEKTPAPDKDTVKSNNSESSNSGEANSNLQPNNHKDALSKRRLSRIGALELLFALSFNRYSMQDAVHYMEYLIDSDDDIERQPISQFSVDLVAETLQNIKKIDLSLKEIIKNWKPERLSVVDRTLLRLGAAEVMFFKDIPPKVTINEYIEIAKEYSDDDAPGFINGILDKLARSQSKLK